MYQIQLMDGVVVGYPLGCAISYFRDGEIGWGIMFLAGAIISALAVCYLRRRRKRAHSS